MVHWQDITAFILVLLAAGYLARRGWQLVFAQRSGQGCTSCGGCSRASSETRLLVSLQLPVPSSYSNNHRIP